MKRATRGAIAAFAMLAFVALAGLLAWFVRLPKSTPGIPAELVPASWEEFRTSRGHETHIGKDDVTCKSCHAYEKEGFKNPGTAVCASCHRAETKHAHGGRTAPEGNADTTSCLSCHAFTPNTEAPRCGSCHAQAQNHVRAIGVHLTTQCTECHKPHAPRASRADAGLSALAAAGDPDAHAHATPKECSTCHGIDASNHAAHAGSNGCADCHAPHTPAAAARETCTSCHTKPAHRTDLPTAHQTCTSCHKPHAFTGTPAVCGGCHAQKTKETLAVAKAPAHAVCTNCHTPHDPTQGPAERCATCHENVHVTHGARGACTTCHTPHGANPNTIASACTDCHKDVATADTGAHAGEIACSKCHARHDYVKVGRDAKLALCTGCHATQAAATSQGKKGHADCTTCHGAAAHRPTFPRATVEATATATTRRTNEVTCGSCHEKQRAAAPSGHQNCAGCHDPHTGARLPQAACASCHAPEAASAHGKTQGGCASCHVAHARAPAAQPSTCTTCHAPASLPNLHTASGHKSCTQCHSAHGGPRADRATCTGSCHASRRDHEPTAQVCTGCHMFRK